MKSTADVSHFTSSLDGSSKRIGLWCMPLDPLFCRDGRPFGAASSGSSSLPMPQTFAGAVRGWMLQRLGKDFDALRAKCGAAKPEEVERILEDWTRDLTGVCVRGPWLAERGKTDGTLEVYISAPADILQRGKDARSFVRAKPQSAIVGWADNVTEKDLPLWVDETGEDKLERAEPLMAVSSLQHYLSGAFREADLRLSGKKLDHFVIHEYRTGIGVHPDSQSAEEGRIYSLQMVRLRNRSEGLNCGFYGEVNVPTGISHSNLDLWFPSVGWTMPLGGEGKRIQVKTIKPIQWPGCASTGGRRVRLLIAPAFFQGRRRDRPALVKERIVATAIPGYVTVSGWDLARRCPKPARHLVRAGSVYYTESSTTDNSTDWPLATFEGYGVFLEGTWLP